MESKKQETANDEEGKETRSSSQKRGDQKGQTAKEEFLGLKLRRGITAAGRKMSGGAHTPVPTWKMEPDDLEVGGGGGGGEGGEGEREGEGAEEVGPSSDKGRRSSVSARQLGASLWEIQSLAPRSKNGRKGNVGVTHRQRHGKGVEDEAGLDDRPRSSATYRQHRMDSVVHHRVKESTRAPLPASSSSDCSSIGGAAVNPVMTPSCSSEIIKTKHGEGRYSLKTSTELLKVLNRIWTLEEQHDSHISLVKSLKAELHNAHHRVKELEGLLKHVSEEKLVKKAREKEKLKDAVQSLQEELLEERRVRKYNESLNKKLGKDLNELKGAFLKAVKDLDKEKRVNSLLEDLCDEFAKGIRGYEEEVRLLKQGNNYNNNSDKFDRLVLHVAEAWLDERMQMQMAEASGDLVEKSAIVERLSGEFKSFLHSKLNSDNDKDTGGKFRRQSLESVHVNGTTSAPRVAEEDDSDSVASDLHCFELDMHANGKPSNSKTKSHSSAEKVTNVKEIKSPDMGQQFCASDPPRRVQRKLPYLDDLRKTISCEIEEVERNLHRKFDKSVDLLPGVRDNRLKAKLIEARLEGRNARLKVSNGASAGVK